MRKILLAVSLVACVLAGCKHNSAGRVDAEEADSAAEADTVVADERGYLVYEGDEAPLFEAVDAATGDTIRLADLRGKVVMLQFTASWCGV